VTAGSVLSDWLRRWLQGGVGEALASGGIASATDTEAYDQHIGELTSALNKVGPHVWQCSGPCSRLRSAHKRLRQRQRIIP
jgi:hypothetical protein